MFQYESLLRKNQIAENSLPAKIKEAIDKLHDLDYELDEEEEDAEIKQLTIEIKSLDAEIVELIVDYLDQESEEDLPESTVRENILSTYFSAGQTKIKLSSLKQSGFKFPQSSKWSEKVGVFRIEKNLFNDFATLTKVA